MVATEITIVCPCRNGHMYLSTWQDDRTGKAVMFILTEDERIHFRGLCDYCGGEFKVSYPVMDLLFKCIEHKEKH